MNRLFKIAIVQKEPSGIDCCENTDVGLKILEDAKNSGADLVLFPECFITGYHFPIAGEYDEWSNRSLSDDSIYIKSFCSKAKELEIGVIITAFTKSKTKPQNSAFLIDRTGKIIMKYSKVHTCDFSNESMLEGGMEFKVCEFDGIKIGIMICYDREYPESARVLMLKGAELILVPNDCGGMKPRIQALSTRAYENMVGIAMANPAGINAGNSCAFSPIVWDDEGNSIDNTIFLADDISKGIFIAEFDIGKIREYRKSEMMGNTFRKVHAYANLLSEEIREPFIRDHQL